MMVAAATAEGVIEGDVVTPAVVVTADDVVAAATALFFTDGACDQAIRAVVTADDVVAAASEAGVETALSDAQDAYDDASDAHISGRRRCQLPHLC